MSRRTIVAITTLALIVLALAFFQTPLMRHARAIAWNGWVISVGRVFRLHDLSPQPDIQERLQELLSENTRLKAELADWRQLQTELETPSIENLRPAPAAVIGRPIDTLQSELVISRGLSSGVATHDPVVIHGSTLIGFVTEVQEHSARVRTIFHPETRVTVEVINQDEGKQPVRGLLESRFFSALYVTTVPRDNTLEESQLIVTVPDEAGVPPGLVIGSVGSIESGEHEAYQEARIRTDYDIDRIRAVTVLTQP